jgi:hypothetical protein
MVIADRYGKTSLWQINSLFGRNSPLYPNISQIYASRFHHVLCWFPLKSEITRPLGHRPNITPILINLA